MGFCKCLVGSLCGIGLLAMAGALTWRYGPWYDESVDPLKGIGGGSSDDLAEPSALAAKDACPTCCNTLASNCDLPVNEVVFPMVHNVSVSSWARLRSTLHRPHHNYSGDVKLR